MKPGMGSAFVLGSIVAVAVLIAVAPPSRGDEAASLAPVLTPQQNASLAALDRALARFDALLARDDDARHQAATRAALDSLRKRRDGLHHAFDQSKYDDLRIDLNLAYQRLAAWMTAPLTPPPATRAP
jgi:hypothetical protein